MPELILRLGTRRSPLALAQSRLVAEAISARHSGVRVELVPVTTRGDREPGDLSKLGGKGLFTAELERGLLDSDLDLAVHSLKDLPVGRPDDLRLAAIPRRADPRDALISTVISELVSSSPLPPRRAGKATALDSLAAGAVVLTGSLRRRAQILHRRPDLAVEPLRGNVGTRLRKWRQSGHAGLVLAMAGLERLGLLDEVPVHPLDPEVFVPAPGQGALAVEVRAGSRAEGLCRAVDHPPSARSTAAERWIVEAFGGDCTLPLAAWARPDGANLKLTALIATADGRRLARGEAVAADPEAVAAACLEALHDAGAGEIVKELGR